MWAVQRSGPALGVGAASVVILVAGCGGGGHTHDAGPSGPPATSSPVLFNKTIADNWDLVETTGKSVVVEIESSSCDGPPRVHVTESAATVSLQVEETNLSSPTEGCAAWERRCGVPSCSRRPWDLVRSVAVGRGVRRTMSMLIF
jgi:hypothetical protein